MIENHEFHDWKCPLCGEELTGAQRVSHLEGHDGD